MTAGGTSAFGEAARAQATHTLAGPPSLTFPPDVVFPGYAAALPVLGAAALLVAGSTGEKALTHRVVRLVPDAPAAPKR